jgi:predicted metal-binding membrane protein
MVARGMSDGLVRLLARDRVVVLLALVSITLMVWAYLLSGAGMNMSAAAMTRMIYGDHSAMNAAMPSSDGWSIGYGLLILGMWIVMMIAMMMPSATPVILLATTINRTASPARAPFAGSGMFLCGYLMAWVLFSVLATVLQWALQRAQLLSAMTLDLGSPVIGGALLLAAAAWQLTPVKSACLRACRSPAQRLVAERGRPGFMIGLRHGAYCVGCCWFLMLLLFVGGVMNLVWIVGLSLYVLAEKLLPGAAWLQRVSAAGLALGGVYLIARGFL